LPNVIDWFQMIIQQIPISAVRIEGARRPLGELAALIESIDEHGLLNPITVTADLRLIAGNHRLEACRRLEWKEISANVLDVDALQAEMAMIDENLARNELSTLECAEQLHHRKHIYEVLHPEARRGGRRGNQHTGGFRRQTAIVAFSQSVAKRQHRSPRTIRTYIQIAKLLDPQARKLLQNSWLEDSLGDLAWLIKFSGSDQAALVEMVLARQASDIREAGVQLDRARRIRSAKLFASVPECTLLHGDFRDVGAEIADSSIDLIITDPPYMEAYLPLHEPLSKFAARVLKPGASMFCMTTCYSLPTVITELGKHLKYQWTLAFVMGGRGSSINARRVRTRFKPVLWFVKDRYTGSTTLDVIPAIGKDKRFHDWGQSEAGFDYLVDRFSKAGETVLDPFLGGGTSAAVALRAGRKFIGIDVDDQALATTLARIQDAHAETASGTERA
jgi:hypothetical protein